jgi:hypothetical protein
VATYADAQRTVAGLPDGEEVFVAEWGHPTFRVRNKMFASGAPQGATMTVKATKEDQAELIAARPDTFSIAAYVGRFGWVEVRLSNVDADELRELLTEAWRLTAPKKLVKEFDG